MARKAKRVRPRRSSRPKARVATKGLKVTAVRTTAGRAATSVQVEVEPEELKDEVGEFGEVRGVAARIPEDDAARPGHVRWRRETLQPAGSTERESEGRRRLVKRYFNVHYGASDTAQRGVGVEVETDRGRVEAPPHGVTDDSRPGESEPAKKR